MFYGEGSDVCWEEHWYTASSSILQDVLLIRHENLLRFPISIYTEADCSQARAGSPPTVLGVPGSGVPGAAVGMVPQPLTAFFWDLLKAEL